MAIDFTSLQPVGTTGEGSAINTSVAENRALEQDIESIRASRSERMEQEAFASISAEQRERDAQELFTGRQESFDFSSAKRIPPPQPTGEPQEDVEPQTEATPQAQASVPENVTGEPQGAASVEEIFRGTGMGPELENAIEVESALGKTFEQAGVQVDPKFLRDVEGFTTGGIVPQSRGKVLGKSGVTVGSGVDLGQQDRAILESWGIPEELIEKVEPYLGVKGEDALQLSKEQPLSLSKQEAIQLTNGAKSSIIGELSGAFSEDSDVSFEQLPPEAQTVIASVVYQYGLRRVKGFNFWRQITGGDWEGALSNLRDFGDAYKTRRNKEADLLEEVIDEMVGS